MNRSIKKATVERFHDDSHDRLRGHPAGFPTAHDFARRLETLDGLTPCEDICKLRTPEPDRFIRNPIHQRSRLNS